jgi:hypothetical protein
MSGFTTPRKVFLKYNGAIPIEELHAPNNLRGIPNYLNNAIHLKLIHDEWNQFYQSHDVATAQEIRQKVTEIDKKYGIYFAPQQGMAK